MRIAFLVCVACFCGASTGQHWLPDREFESITDGGCDFQIFDVADIDSVNLGLEKPYIIRGLIDEWPALTNWQKEQFLRLYGGNVVRTGSESSIVHSGGVAENDTTLADLVTAMGIRSDVVYGDSFLFDTTVLKTIPALKEDFTVPDIFEEWDNTATEGRSQLWHMLSLGPSRSGLPFHNHGKTWLAVVHGIKQWFLYPPGYDPPRNVDESFNPMFPVSKWLEDVYASIKTYPKPPTLSCTEGTVTCPIGTEVHIRNHSGYRPLECRQHAGDVMFLPTRWTHLTVNMGETIAIGGQETLYDQDRMDRARAVLETTLENFDAWRDLGLAQFNMANHKIQEVRGLVKEFVRNGPLMLRDLKSLDALLEKTRDTWVVLYYDSTATAGNATAEAELATIKLQWAVLAQLARDSNSFNVAALDIAGQYTVLNLTDEMRTGDLHAVRGDRTLIRTHQVPTDHVEIYRVDDLHTFIALPTIKFHRGDVFQLAHPDSFLVDTEGMDYDGDLSNSQEIFDMVTREMKAENLAVGSVESVSVQLRRDFQESLLNMKKARQIKPLQPELLCMIGEIAGLAHDFDSMDDALLGAGRVLDAINRHDIAALSLASTYHKLAHVYIKLEHNEYALPLLQRSLQALPTFLPSMLDYVYVHVALGDRNAAEFALEQVKLVKSGVEDSPEFRKLAGQVQETPWL